MKVFTSGQCNTSHPIFFELLTEFGGANSYSLRAITTERKGISISGRGKRIIALQPDTAIMNSEHQATPGNDPVTGNNGAQHFVLDSFNLDDISDFELDPAPAFPAMDDVFNFLPPGKIPGLPGTPFLGRTLLT